MEGDGSGVSALLGLEGFVVRAPLLDEASGEQWLAVETTEDPAWLPVLWRPVGRPRPPTGQGEGSAAGGPPGDAGVGQAPVALPGGGASSAHVVRGFAIRFVHRWNGMTPRASWDAGRGSQGAIPRTAGPGEAGGEGALGGVDEPPSGGPGEAGAPTCDDASRCELVIESDDPEDPSRKHFVTRHLRSTLRSALKCWAAQERHEILEAES
jgi:hypothetical protein